MTVLIPVAHGSESLETISLCNILRRGEIDVVLASIEESKEIEGTRDVKFVADASLGEVASRDYDAIIVPGGEAGSRRLGANQDLIDRLLHQRQSHSWYGAICAAPALTLTPNGLLDGKQATCHPAFKGALLHHVDQNVVIDGHCMTSKGVGTCLEFALTWVEKLRSRDQRQAIAESICLSS